MSQKMKRECVGFDLRVKLDEEDTPDAIVWMTLTMRQNLLQYGDILFLDAQKRQCNKMCWPCIGPVVKTSVKK